MATTTSVYLPRLSLAVIVKPPLLLPGRRRLVFFTDLRCLRRRKFAEQLEVPGTQSGKLVAVYLSNENPTKKVDTCVLTLG